MTRYYGGGGGGRLGGGASVPSSASVPGPASSVPTWQYWPKYGDWEHHHGGSGMVPCPPGSTPVEFLPNQFICQPQWHPTYTGPTQSVGQAYYGGYYPHPYLGDPPGPVHPRAQATQPSYMIPQAQAVKGWALVVYSDGPHSSPMMMPFSAVTRDELCTSLSALYQQNPKTQCSIGKLVPFQGWIWTPAQTVVQALIALNCPR